MKVVANIFRLPTLALAFALGATAQGAVDRTVERTFAVSGPIDLRVDTFYGSIKIVTTTKPEIHLLVRESLDAKDDKDADEELRDLNLQIEETKPGLFSVKAEYKRSVRWTWEKWPPIVLAFELEVPVQTSVHLISRDGALSIDALKGTVDARSQSGEIFIGKTDGAVTAWSGQGNVTVASCTGKLSVTARGGNVLVGRVSGHADITDVGGSIEVQSSQGNLRVNGDGADLKASFVYPLLGDAELLCAGGDISASFESNVAAEIDAHASTFGQVKTRNLDLKPSAGQPGDAHLVGTLNASGHRIVIRARGGNVHLLGVPPSS